MSQLSAGVAVLGVLGVGAVKLALDCRECARVAAKRRESSNPWDQPPY